MSEKTGSKFSIGRDRDGKLFQPFDFFLLAIVIGTLIFVLASPYIYGIDSHITANGVRVVDGWYYTDESGEKVSLSFPETVKADSTGRLTIETILPGEITDRDYLATRLLKTDAYVYVDGELRSDLTDYATKPFRQENYSRYVFVPLTSADSGKIIRIELFKKVVKKYSIVPFYLGEKSAETLVYRKAVLAPLILGISLLVIGICAIFYGLALRIRKGQAANIDYLGWALFLISLWDITQSEFREFYFFNIRSVSLVPPLCLIGYSLALCLYYNSLQKYRYAKAYSIFFIAGVVNAVTAVILQMSGTVDIYSDLPVIFALLGILIIMCLFTMARDWKNGYAQKYRFVFVGTILMAICGIVQILIFIFDPYYSNALGLTLGTFLFVVFAVIHALNNVAELETENKAALRTADLKGKFLASMSHEIRTPINAVLGMNEMILRETSEEAVKNYASEVDTAGKMLLSLINDILDFSKLESGNMPIVPMEYESKPLIESCYNMLKRRAEDKGLELIVRADSNIPSRLCGDSVRITQIIVNMLTNAVKYTDHGSVTFETTVEDVTPESVMLVCRVSDTGRGIKEEDIGKLFSSFKRLDENENISIEGTGLGLAITKTLVTLMQGTISVESKYAKGSVFTVKIPQKIIDKTPIGIIDKESITGAQTSEVSDIKKFSEVKVLAVDDVPVNLKVVSAFLGKMGIDVDCAKNGDECIEKACLNKYDLILLDHMMPGKNGIETFHELQSLENNKNKETPFIMLTANAIMGAREQFLEEGFDDFISKPFTLQEIQKVIQKYIS